MHEAHTTCWTLVEAAAAGGHEERCVFARRYSPIIRAYLEARWRETAFLVHIEDACQDVFVECFRDNGPLNRADRDRLVRFRTFLYGIVRNIALRNEQRNGVNRGADELQLENFESDETQLSRVFDRAWAQQILQEAVDRQREVAESRGSASARRVELLRLRFHEDLPVREIARRWSVDTHVLHRELSKAKMEFKDALRETVAARHQSISAAEIDRECREVISLISSE